MDFRLFASKEAETNELEKTCKKRDDERIVHQLRTRDLLIARCAIASMPMKWKSLQAERTSDFFGGLRFVAELNADEL